MILERSAVSVLLSLFLTGMYKEAMMANVTEWAELVADSGMALLRNGAETYRTNETMEYMDKDRSFRNSQYGDAISYES